MSSPWLQSITERRQDRNSRQDSEGKNQSRAHGGALLTSWFPMAHTATFLTQPLGWIPFIYLPRCGTTHSALGLPT